MQSSQLFSFVLSSLALTFQAASALMPTSASEYSQHISHKSHYIQPYHEKPRSLNIEDFPLTVLPTRSRAHSPIVLKLHPSAGKPSHLHANLPLRFGRTTGVLLRKEPQISPKSSLNLPQRFGRSEVCSKCRRSGTPPSATLPQRFGRRNVLDAIGWLPIRTLFILAPASKSPQDKIRTSFDDGSSEWTEDTAEKRDRIFMDF
ncbi:pro-FMRFamide-related neuropeptide VF [Alosa sapidissima]|uniref:pro-FMRFamide-related neuropeptide VF n=1 Tax=Alosa sapidissima TaxID=34773 RepID=UPI001C08DA1F|nr:pro-FMRFamide-related neuropeptide VF [Alosa sapidissima]